MNMVIFRRNRELITLVLVTILVGCSERETSIYKKTLQRIEVTPDAMTLEINQEQSSEAFAHYSDGSITNITNIASWVAETPNIVDIIKPGKLIGLDIGQTKVYATFEDIKSAPFFIQVINANDNIIIEPVAYDQVITIRPNEEVYGKLKSKDYTDQEVEFSILKEPEFGTLVLDQSSGEFVYQNNETSNNDSFSFMVSNSRKNSQPAEVLIGITPYELNKIQGDINDGSKMNFVFVADGFTQSDMYLFNDFVKSTTEHIFNYGDAMINQKNAWNVYSLETLSNQSGVSYEDGSPGNGGTEVDNLFGSHFWCNGIERLLCISDMQQVMQYTSDAVPNWDNILLVSNSTNHGGAGYMNARFSTSTISNDAGDTVIHEMGHGFFNLDDEYAYEPYNYEPPTSEPNRANITIEDHPNLVKWKTWLGEMTSDGSEVGLYEGGAVNIPYGVWRPTQTSIMKVLGHDFEPINREAWLLKIYQTAGIITDYYPRKEKVIADSGAMIFELKPLIAKNVSTTWYVDGVHQPEFKDQLIFEVSVRQDTDIAVVVEDDTGWIRNDPNNFSTQTVRWKLCEKVEECAE